MQIFGFKAFRYFLIVSLYLFGLPNAAQAQTIVSGILNSDRTWTQLDGPYVIEDNVTVAAQVTLTIEPGVLVKFTGPHWLKVEGTLLAQGSADELIIFSSDASDRYWHRLEFLPGSDASILDYVRLTNAGNDSAGGSQAYGALYLAGSTPQLSHLFIQNNHVCGLFAENITTELAISDSQFTNNINNTTAGVGAGGIFIEGTSSASITLRNNIIGNNRTNSHGGGVYISGAGSVSLDGNQIANNHAESNLGFGGGLYLANLGGDMAQNSIMNNTISNNVADKDGGGVWLDESQITVRDNVLDANMALDSQGGAIYIGDANAQDLIKSVSAIHNNLVYDNYSLELGGAFYIENGTHTISDNVLFGNSADDGGGDITNEQGGALMLHDGVVNFNNNVVAENAAANGGAISITGSGNVSNNSFVHNLSRHILRLAGNLTVHGNTFADNVGELSILYVPFQLDPIPVVNNNNFFNGDANDSIAYVVDNLNAGLLNAQSNWWDTIDEESIAWQLSATVDYSNYTLEPLTDTPVAPPEITDVTFTADSASLVWEARSESDVAGYKVYWGENPAPMWEHAMDSGTDTAITISGLASNKSYYFAVTAYDAGFGGDLAQTAMNEDQLSGHESWYGRPVYKSAANAQTGGGGGGGSGLGFVTYLMCLIAITVRVMAQRRARIRALL
jgi:hypothetical protein